MNRFILILISSCFTYIACDSSPNYTPALKGVAYSGDQKPSSCLVGKNFAAKEGSYISWHAMKISTAGALVPLTGTNAIVGNLNIKNDTWKEATTTINFVSSSTNSEDPIRDSRINSFVFGLPESLPFKFQLVEITGDNLEMQVNMSKNVVVKGILYVGDQTASIEMPALIKEMPDMISITPAEVFMLNVRALSPVVNGVNLVDKITQLLSFVPGVEMHDEVTIDFNLEFKPSSCN